MARVSVIIPHYNDLESLALCLDALCRQEFAEPFEIIVADNASPVGVEAVERMVAGRAMVVIAHEKGAGPARNAGVAASSGAILAFTDCDCVPAPGWLAAGVAALSSHDFVGGGMTVLTDGMDRADPAVAFELGFAFDNRTYVEEKGFTVTANLFCTRAVFDATGPFRVGVSEDVEWCQRAATRGYRIGYAPDALVGHPARKDWDALIKKWRRINSETYELIAERPLGSLRWLARTWALPLSILAHIPRAWRSPQLHSAAERRACVAGLVRLRLWRFVHSHRLLFGMGQG